MIEKKRIKKITHYITLNLENNSEEEDVNFMYYLMSEKEGREVHKCELYTYKYNCLWVKAKRGNI